MGKTIAVWTSKGGTGKTALATAVARWPGWGQDRLLIDLDPQGNASLICGHPISDRQPGISSALMTRTFPEDQCVDIELDDGTTLVPADSHMPDLDILLRKTTGTPTLALAQLLSSIETTDITIIDCPPGENIFSRMALAAADYLLLPTTIDAGAATGIQQALSVCDKIKKGNLTRQEPAFNPNLKILGIVYNKIPTIKINICSEIKTVINDFCTKRRIQIFDSEIKERISPMTFINANQQSVFDLPKDNRLLIEIESLCNEIKKKMGMI